MSRNFRKSARRITSLKTPNQHAKYDQEFRRKNTNGTDQFPKFEEIRIDEKSAIFDAGVHEKILFFLYKRRREHADDAGVMGYYVQRMLDCSDDNYEFHVWYLKSKGFIKVTEQGTLAITIEGVNHVIALSRTIEAKKLLIPQSDTAKR